MRSDDSTEPGWKVMLVAMVRWMDDSNANSVRDEVLQPHVYGPMSGTIAYLVRTKRFAFTNGRLRRNILIIIPVSQMTLLVVLQLHSR